MAGIKSKQTCPRCRQVSGVEIIYGSVDTLSEALRNALKDGDVVLGGTYPKWDWEEELINTRCLRCHHEWHEWSKTFRHKHHLIQPEVIEVSEMLFWQCLDFKIRFYDGTPISI